MTSISAQPGFKMALRTLWVSGPLMFFALIFLTYLQPVNTYLPLDTHIQSPSMALQLSQSAADIGKVIGEANTPEGTEFRNRFDRALKADFLLILAYSFFNLALGYILFREKHMPALLWYLFLLVITMTLLADSLENLATLRLLKESASERIDQLALLMNFSSRLKWLLFGLSAIIYIIAFRQKKINWAAIFYLAILLLALVGQFYPVLLEWEGVYLGLAWASIWYRSLPTATSWWPQAD